MVRMYIEQSLIKRLLPVGEQIPRFDRPWGIGKRLTEKRLRGSFPIQDSPRGRPLTPGGGLD